MSTHKRAYEEAVARAQKRVLELAGVVDAYGGGLCDVGPRIGGVDVIEAIDKRWPPSHGNRGKRDVVRVFLGVEPVAEGPLWALHGFGGTDVTPADSPEITVGDYDLIYALNDLDGREVLLVVEDAEKR